jgi:PKD repeat protein
VVNDSTRGYSVSYPFLRSTPQSPAPGRLTWYADGAGTRDAPYEIATWAQLDNVRWTPDDAFVLTADLNETTAGYEAIAAPATNGGAGFRPIRGAPDQPREGFQGTGFSGSFDGRGHSIGNLTVDRPDEDSVGLFGRVESGEVTNVSLTAARVTGANRTGGLVGSAIEAEVANVTLTESSVTGANETGGLAGYNNGTNVTDSTVDGHVTGDHEVGGLVGSHDSVRPAESVSPFGQVNRSSAAGTVTGSTGVGGLVGKAYNVQEGDFEKLIVDSHATADVTGDLNVGGLAGVLAGSSGVSRSFATGAVNGTENVGGLVGAATVDVATRFGTAALATYIDDSYATGTVTGEKNVGGFIGTVPTGNPRSIQVLPGDVRTSFPRVRIFSSYATGDVHGGENVGGFVGQDRYANTTEEFQNFVDSTYATGTVTGTRNVGGYIGLQRGVIEEAYATGAVDGTEHVGGLAGAVTSGGLVRASYAVGTVTGDDRVGGLVGRTGDGGRAVVSYWDVETTGRTDSATGTGLTTSAFVGHTGSTNVASYWRESFAPWEFFAGNGVVSYPFFEFTRPPLPGAEKLYADGNGTVGNPYQIETWHQLDRVRHQLPAHFVLANDLNETTPGYEAVAGPAANGGAGFQPIAGDANQSRDGFQGTALTGSFDGNGHTVSGMRIDRPDEDYVGLFGRVASGGTVRNVSVTDGRIAGANRTGGLAGQSRGAVTGSYATVSVTGDRAVGGLLGDNAGSVTASYATGRVTGDRAVGGFIGTLSDGGSVSQSYAAGPVNGSTAVGGFVGRAADSATVSVSYWDELASGQTTSAGGSGRGTNDLTGEDVANETALAVGTTWRVDPGSPVSYPYLVSNVQSPLPTPSDTTSPTVEAFGATSQPGQDIRVTVVASERLSRLGLSLGGPEQATYTIDAFTESRAGEGYRYTVTYDGDTDGTYTATLVDVEDLVGNDGQIGLLDTATVSQTSETFRVNVTGTSPGDSLNEGETLSVTATVANVGDGIGTQPVTLRDFDGTVVDSRSVSLAEGTRRTVTLEWTPEGGDAGSGPITVASANDTDTRTVRVGAGAPTAEAGAIRTLVTGFTAAFDGTESDDETGIETYEWAFGDGTTATGPTPTHAYNRTGTYTVTLTVTDAGGNTETDTTTVTVLDAGSGTPTDPYVITTLEQLQRINASNERRAAHYELGADIDASETSEWNDGRGFEPIGWLDLTGRISSPPDDSLPFTGTFDGNGHTISGLTIDRGARAGLFGFIGEGGEVRNVTLEAVDVTGKEPDEAYYTGGIAAAIDGTVTGVGVTGSVSGGPAGGVAGLSLNGTVADSRSAVTVDSSGEAGGLVGYLDDGAIVIRSHATGRVVSSDPGGYAGGLVGINTGGTIDRSYATGNVSGPSAGGLVGWNRNEPFVLDPDRGTITQSYATGRVSGYNEQGGLVGFFEEGTVTASYWDTETTGQGSSGGGDGVTGLTTAEMVGGNATTTMTGLDFGTTWAVRTGDRPSYPYLQTVGLAEYPTPGKPAVRPGLYFVATVNGTTSPVDEGEPLRVNATVTNAGTEAGTQTVTLSDDSGTVRDSQSVSLDAGASTTVALDWATDLGDNATDSVSVATGNVTDTANVTVRPTSRTVPSPGNLSVEVLATTAPTTEGDSLTVVVNVTNTDTEPGRQSVSLADFDGDVVDRQSVMLDAGASTRLTLAWPTESADANTGTITVASLNDTATRDARVASPGANDPPVGGTDRYAVAAGETLSVDAPGVLANDGDPDGDPLSVTTTPVSGPAYGTVDLSANGSFTYTPGRIFTASGTTDGVTGLDSFAYEVRDGRGGTDVASVAVSVREAVTQPVSNLSIGGEGSTGTIVAGDEAEIVVRVRNVGTEATTVPVRFGIGEQVTRTRTVGPVPAGESVSVDVRNVTTGLGTGRYPVTVSTADDTTTGWLRVVSPTPLSGGEERPTDPDGDGLYEDIDGDGETTYADVVALFEGFETEGVAANGVAFDFNRNGRVDFDDIVTLYRGL